MILAAAIVTMERERPDGFTNREVAVHLPNRTANAVRCHRNTKGFMEVLRQTRCTDDLSILRDCLRRTLGPVPLSGSDTDTDAASSIGDGSVDREDVLRGDHPEQNWETEMLDWFANCGCEDPYVISLLETLRDGDEDGARSCLESWFQARVEDARNCPKRRRRWIADPPANESRRQKRAREYREIQNLYRVNRSAAAERILSGEWKGTTRQAVSKEQLIRYWSGLYCADRRVDQRPVPEANIDWSLMRPITPNEVLDTLKRTKNSAPGPDGVEVRALKRYDTLALACAFNAVLFLRTPPDTFIGSRTVLIPKSPNPVEASDFRPISIASVFARCFHKIIAGRLSSSIELLEDQRAFRKTDGTATNLVILESLINEAKMRFRSLCVAFVDLRKAFDTVSHDSILRVASARGVPAPLTDYLRLLYGCSYTTLLGRRYRVKNGVRQGDPLSPLLFNAVVDEGLVAVKRLGLGFEMNGHVYRFLAFADDIVFVSETPVGLERQLSVFLEVMRVSGLEINGAKSATLRIVGCSKQHTYFVDERPFIRVTGAEQFIPALKATDTYKYLGLCVGVSGRHLSSGAKLAQMLEELTRCPLKPQQRLYLLRNHVYPRMIHRLVLGPISVGMLKRLDKATRTAVKRWLKLPMRDTPVGLIHAGFTDGGLGVPSFRTSVPRMRKRRVERLQTCREPSVRSVWTSAGASRYRSTPGMRVAGGDLVATRADELKYWKDRLRSTIDGAGTEGLEETPVVNRWVGSGTSFLTGRSYIRSVMLRGCQALVPARTARWSGRNVPFCDAGCRVSATLNHMVQACPRTHAPRVDRHDRLNSRFAKWFERKGAKVQQECRVVTASGLRIPDLVVHTVAASWVIDTSIITDAGVEAMRRARVDKIAKYDRPEIRAMVERARREHGFPVGAVLFDAVILSWRGALLGASATVLRRLGLTASQLELTSVIVLEETWKVYTWYRGSTVSADRINREAQ